MWLRQRLSSHAGCGGGGVAVERDAEEACAVTATGRGWLGLGVWMGPICQRNVPASVW
jgi:hypothetical protein